MINAILKLPEIQNSGKKNSGKDQGSGCSRAINVLGLQLPLRSAHLLYLEQKIVSASLLIIFFLLLDNFFFLLDA